MKISFDSVNIWRRLEQCKIVALAYGWHPNDWIHFRDEVTQATSYEEAMMIIERDFEITHG